MAGNSVFLSALLAVTAGATVLSPGRTLPGPPSQDAQPAWLASLYAFRDSARKSVNFSTEVYDNYLLWSPTLFIAPQSHIYDRYLYDPSLAGSDPAAGWTVDRFLDDLEARYGGIDGVLLWGTYPNMGVDERSQFDLLEDVPGGLAALKAVVAQFNKRGVRVGLPYNPWDTGTARRTDRDETVLAQLAAAIGAEFANGDTMQLMDANFWSDSVAAGRPLALQPEGGPLIQSLEWTKMGWGYWPQASPVPDVDGWKWLEHRHVSQICNRWNVNHTIDLQQALFNGDGFVSWESVWGTWNGMSLHDAEATRRVGSLLRFLAPFFYAGPEADSTTWEPHTRVTSAAYAAGVFASRWQLPVGGASSYAANATAYTLVDTSLAVDWTGPTLPVPCDGGGRVWFDLYSGTGPLSPVPSPDGGCALSLSLESRGYGAVLALAPTDASPLPANLSTFLAKMASMTARPLASFDITPTYLQQTMTFIAPAPLSALPSGMVSVPGASAWRFASIGTEIEGRTVVGNDVQYPWEDVATTTHSPHRIDVPNLYVDATPVTNQQYAAFLAATGYTPADDYHFLLDWAGSRTPPAGWENKPVTWVDLNDARAFCAAAGKRLPHDWEWQYAAQGGDPTRAYPWGGAWDDGAHVPRQVNGTTRPAPPDVGSVPSGDTPSGLKDMMGLVWQWTDEFADDHTRAGLVRGGSYYSATGSLWYFPNWQGPLPIPAGHSGQTNVDLHKHGKLLLMAPSYDRHGAVGFRCVADAPGHPPPPPPPQPSGCADGLCDAFCDHATVQGCAATLPTGVSMRAPPSGKPCGGALGPCAAPADACAPGWALCLSDWSSPSLSADGLRARMTASTCSSGDAGRYIAAMSHSSCDATCHTDPPVEADVGCKATGCGAEAVCCGSDCVPAGCKNALYVNSTTIYDDQRHGCGFVTAAVADGVLCCRIAA